MEGSWIEWLKNGTLVQGQGKCNSYKKKKTVKKKHCGNSFLTLVHILNGSAHLAHLLIIIVTIRCIKINPYRIKYAYTLYTNG